MNYIKSASVYPQGTEIGVYFDRCMIRAYDSEQRLVAAWFSGFDTQNAAEISDTVQYSAVYSWFRVFLIDLRYIYFSTAM